MPRNSERQGGTDVRNPAKRIGKKLCTIDELVGFLGTFPRPKRMKVIMCHGVFDIVHPGHLRHLLYAKSKADVLVASITADRHIVKGTYRPHVPQDLRAQNLAALEMVDYVVIDDNPTPLENIRRLQPDFFAKSPPEVMVVAPRDCSRSSFRSTSRRSGRAWSPAMP